MLGIIIQEPVTSIELLSVCSDDDGDGDDGGSPLAINLPNVSPNGLMRL